MKALARVAERFMNDKNLLIEAIDHYEAYSPSYRKILKTLVELSIDDIVNISVLQLSKLTLLSRETIYQAFNVMEQDNLIEVVKQAKGKISFIALKAITLNKIIQYYNKQVEVYKKYTNITQ